VFERKSNNNKSINKQFDRAEIDKSINNNKSDRSGSGSGQNVNVTQQHNHEIKTERMTERTTDRTTDRSSDTNINMAITESDNRQYISNKRDRNINININQIKEREDKSDNIQNINNNVKDKDIYRDSTNNNQDEKNINNNEKGDKNYSMLPELRSKSEVKIEPYIFSRSNNAWKAITPFKYMYVP